MLSIIAVAVFLIAYALIASEKVNRVAVVSGGAAIMFFLGATNPDSAFYSHETGIDWNVIFLLMGMMIIVSIIHKTGLFEYLAVSAIKFRKGSPRGSFAAILILVAVASALLDNVTTILLAVPMTFLVTEKLRVSPIPFILGEVFVSNIGGAATLIGDPPNIIIASKAGIEFIDFLIHMAPLVVVALLFTIPLLMWMFRSSLVNSAKDRAEIMKLQAKSFITDSKLLTKSVVVLGIVIIGFLLHSLIHIDPSVVAMSGAGLLILISKLKPAEFARDVEWGTLAFFAGLFIMVGALVNVGALAALSNTIAAWVGDDSKLAAGSIVVLSALVSGVVDNIPYVASMIPVVDHLNTTIESVSNDGLWWALAFGADFGGNLTIIGASANVVAISLAHAKGVHISFLTFLKYGLPVTILSIGLALPYVLIRYF